MFNYSSIYIFQLLRQPFLTFVFVLFFCVTNDQIFDWLKKQSLQDISNLDKSNWYFSPLIDRLKKEYLTSCFNKFEQLHAT